jgi:hypothetical protein
MAGHIRAKEPLESEERLLEQWTDTPSCTFAAENLLLLRFV